MRCNWIRLCACWVAVVVVAVTAGCETGLRTEYGSSSGVAGDRSINGFGVLRRYYEKRGWTTREVNRLNERVKNVNAIVWLPQYHGTLNDDAIDWFDQWLSEQTRTLIYIVPDDGCETRYLEAARQMAPGDQRIAYRRRLARLQTDQLLSRLQEEATTDSHWFSVERLPDATTLDGTSGPWRLSSSTAGPTKSTAKSGFNRATVKYKIATSPTVVPNSTSSTATPNASAPTPGPPAGQPASALTAVAGDVEHATLLRASDASPVVVRLTAQRWNDSQLLVVAGGSLLCNFAMTTFESQSIASHLVADTGAIPGTVGFMTTDYRGAVVSDVNPEINRQTGMELLTVWPLSLIMLHLAIMGFIACMILVPIFGRPRELQTAAASDFADHLDAVAALMSKSGGEAFARRRVSDYMRRIRGETSSPWILDEQKPEGVASAPVGPPTVDPAGNYPELPSMKEVS